MLVGHYVDTEEAEMKPVIVPSSLVQTARTMKPVMVSEAPKLIGTVARQVRLF